MNFEKGNLRNSVGKWSSFPWLIVILLFLASMSSCSVTEHLGKDEYLLKSDVSFTKVEPEVVDSTAKRKPFSKLKELGLATVDESVLSSSIRTRSNKRMVIPKSYLHLFMLGKSIQTPLDSLMPPTRAGRTRNGKWMNDFRVLSQSPQKVLATIKYFDYRLSGGRWMDSLGTFLTTIGEEPAILDLEQLRQDQDNLKQVYFSEGFFYATDTFEIDTLRKFSLFHRKDSPKLKKVKVNFLVNEGKAAIIDRYEINEDQITSKAIYQRLKSTEDRSLLKPGDIYKDDNMVAERARIVDQMRNNGWYSFSPQMVLFNVDTLPDSVAGTTPNNPAIKEGRYSPVVVQVRIAEAPLIYNLGSITLNVDAAEFDPEKDTLLQIINSELINDSLREEWGITRRIYSDTNSVIFMGYPRVMKKLNLNFLEDLVEQELDVDDLGELSYVSGERYSLIVERSVQRRLQSLGIFKYVLVKHTLDDHTLHIRIQAQLLQKYQVKAGAEGFSQNDPYIARNLPGFGFEVGLRDLLVFKGAERLDFHAAGNASFFRTGEGDERRTFLAGNTGLNFTVPRFMVPFVGSLIRKNLQTFNPTTSFRLDGTREDSHAYTRNSFTTNWNYSWTTSTKKENENLRHSLSPYVMTVVNRNLSDDFRDSLTNIEDKNLRNLFALDFARRFSSWGRYQVVLSDYQSSKIRPTAYLQLAGEMGGNTPYLIDRFGHLLRDSVKFFQADDVGFRDAKLGNIQYGQYLKVSAESRLNAPISDRMHFVLRGLIGISTPWNFTRLVPLTSRFFAGGVNGMRGWQSNTLGPGKYVANIDESTESLFGNILNLGGEFQMEFNAEFRANVYNWVELAIFSDIGNVWFMPGSDLGFENQEDAILSKNTIGELGWDMGLGIRLDFDFFVFRVDFAQQLYAPDIQSFVVKSFPRDLGGSRFQTNFGIGYPF